jgi:hypothetical protein
MAPLTAVPDAEDATAEAYAHLADAATRALSLPLPPKERDTLLAIRRDACSVAEIPVVEDADTSEAAAMRRIVACMRAELPLVTSKHWRRALEHITEGLDDAAHSRAKDGRTA